MANLLEKVGQRYRANKAYAEHSNRPARAKRLSRKLRGYYSDNESDIPGRTVVESIAAYTYQTRPLYHYRRPHISIDARTPQYITDKLSADGASQTLNNARNAVIAEVALNQEFRRIEIEDEINMVLQDAICPYDAGMIKVGYENHTQFTDETGELQVNDRIWAKRTCPADVFPAWDSRDRKSVRDYFHRIHKPVQWVKDNKDFLSKGREACNVTKLPDFLSNRVGTTEGTPYDMTEIVEYHDVQNGQIGVLTANADKWLIEPYDFPYAYEGPQFVFFVPFPLNDEFYGRSPTHMIEPQVDEQQEYRSRMLSIYKRWPMILKGRTGAMSKGQLEKWRNSEDAEYLETDGDVEVITLPQIPQAFFGIQDLIERDMERVGNTSSMRRGETSAVRPTTAQIIEGHGSLRDADIREEVAKLYNRTAQKSLDLMIQFYTAPRWVKLSGGKYKPEQLGDLHIEQTAKGPFALYTNSDIAGSYDFGTDVSSLVPINNEVRAQTLMRTLEMIPKLPPIVQENFLKKYDLSEIIVELVGMQGIDLKRYEAEEEPGGPEGLTDPIAENNHILHGGILAFPNEDEPHKAHRQFHDALEAQLAQNPQDPRYMRIKDHNDVHRAYEAEQQIAAQGGQQMQNGMGPGMGPVMPGMMNNGTPMAPGAGAVPMAPRLTPVRPVAPTPGGFNGGGGLQ